MKQLKPQNVPLALQVANTLHQQDFRLQYSFLFYAYISICGAPKDRTNQTLSESLIDVQTV